MRYFFLFPLLTPILANPIGVTGNSTLESRDLDVGASSDLTITAWSSNGCRGASNTWKGKYYGVNQTWPSGFRSYSLSRAVQDDEQLDFSTSGSSAKAGAVGTNSALVWDPEDMKDSCSVFVMKAQAPDERSKGCHSLRMSSQCVNLWIPS